MVFRLFLFLTPKIISDNYSSIEKKQYHIDFENYMYERKIEQPTLKEKKQRVDELMNTEQEQPDTLQMKMEKPDEKR